MNFDELVLLVGFLVFSGIFLFVFFFFYNSMTLYVQVMGLMFVVVVGLSLFDSIRNEEK